jgi:hypothetical protein
MDWAFKYETPGICAIVAVVDTRRVLRARETTARGVYPPAYAPDLNSILQNISATANDV